MPKFNNTSIICSFENLCCYNLLPIVDFVCIWEVSLLQWSRFLEFVRLLNSKKNCPAYELLPGWKVGIGRDNYLRLVDQGDSWFLPLLACSSHPQETEVCERYWPIYWCSEVSV